MTVLPRMLIAPLQSHLAVVRERHGLALRDGYAGVELPDAIARKIPSAAFKLPWQYVVPAETLDGSAVARLGAITAPYPAARTTDPLRRSAKLRRSRSLPGQRAH